MRNTIYLILTFVILISCKEDIETNFEKDGISLTCPKGWTITEEETIEDQGYFLSIEKNGINSSGLVTLTWINNNLDLNEWLNIYIDEFKNNIIYENSIVFGKQSRNKYNNINTISINYTVNIIGVKHRGIIYAFNENNKTVAILKQEAIEDINYNMQGFEIIEKSFKVK